MDTPDQQIFTLKPKRLGKLTYYQKRERERERECCVFRPACACLRMVENDKKRSKIINNVKSLLSFFIMRVRGSAKAQVGILKKVI